MTSKIAILTSGGDAPGMNAAIRAVTRSALAAGLEVFGVQRGYAGLAGGDLLPLGARDVGGILDRAGTMLGSARFPQLKDPEVRKRALDLLAARGVDGLVVIGGNGSQTGAAALSKDGLKVIGIASTIDNDLIGSDMTLGVDTALHVAVEAIDRLRATAASHRRCAIVEVMGRDCGHLALMSGIAGGAEAVVLPEIAVSPESVAAQIRAAYERGKSHAIVVVAEGAALGATALAAYFSDQHADFGYELRVTVLGHVQRGGTPTPFDRLLGSKLGVAAVDHLAAGRHGVVLGVMKGELAATPLDDVVGQVKPLDPELLRTAHLLAR